MLNGINDKLFCVNTCFLENTAPDKGQCNLSEVVLNCPHSS